MLALSHALVWGAKAKPPVLANFPDGFAVLWACSLCFSFLRQLAQQPNRQPNRVGDALNLRCSFATRSFDFYYPVKGFPGPVAVALGFAFATGLSLFLGLAFVGISLP